MESKPVNFITGATGLVGAHLCLYLLQHQEKVVALYRTEKAKNKTKELFVCYQKSHLFDKSYKNQSLDIPCKPKRRQDKNNRF